MKLLPLVCVLFVMTKVAAAQVGADRSSIEKAIGSPSAEVATLGGRATTGRYTVGGWRFEVTYMGGFCSGIIYSKLDESSLNIDELKELLIRNVGTAQWNLDPASTSDFIQYVRSDQAYIADLVASRKFLSVQSREQQGIMLQIDRSRDQSGDSDNAAAAPDSNRAMELLLQATQRQTSSNPLDRRAHDKLATFPHASTGISANDQLVRQKVEESRQSRADYERKEKDRMVTYHEREALSAELRRLESARDMDTKANRANLNLIREIDAKRKLLNSKGGQP